MPPDILPLRLLSHRDGDFFVFSPDSTHGIHSFHIVSYTWGSPIPPWQSEIAGVQWPIKLEPEKLEEIKRLMLAANIQYLWADCLCINQVDSQEMAIELAKMYDYYKGAEQCHILMNMPHPWIPQQIVDDLKFLDHVLSEMHGAAVTAEANLTQGIANRLAWWAKSEWKFDIDPITVRSAAIDMGVLNCYATCIKSVRSLFQNMYFSRVWTFQEMLLGKNIVMWGVNGALISYIGTFDIWMDLATDSKDKAYKLQEWIQASRILKTSAVGTIIRIIVDDNLSLSALQLQVKGVRSARTDIINGGPFWWHENERGISNIFSAISLTPRKAEKQVDIFVGLLGIFKGLFTPEEIRSFTQMGNNDIDIISFAFFKQLSLKTGYAWTKLAISSQDRGEWDWIPTTAKSEQLLTTDCFAGIVRLGKIKQKGLAKAIAQTGIQGSPRKYMRISLRRKDDGDGGIQFMFKGCNCGKKIKTGRFSSQIIPTHNQTQIIVKDETGRVLVQCATILGSLFDPGYDVVEYRRRLLGKLQPNWNYTDPSAKPINWIDRTVSGTSWANPGQSFIRPHNRSMNYKMMDVTGCESRLHNENTKDIMCDVSVICGCTITAPFSMLFEAITAVEESCLGNTALEFDLDNDRIELQDGLGLVQVGDVGKSFSLIAFGGDIDYQRLYASSCRNTKEGKTLEFRQQWPTGRALVREEFTHDFMAMARDYGYVDTGGSGNLVICRNHRFDDYKIIGVCIDRYIACKKQGCKVNIR